jgi:putative transposase
MPYRNRGGRPVPGYSLSMSGEKIPDEQIKEYLCEIVSDDDGFPYGYHKLTAVLVDDYSIIVNHKKVYRLCKELQILKPQRVCKRHHPRSVARRMTITGPNQLWEMDMKYGYIHGEDRFFFQLSLIDVFDRNVIAYHLGLTCTGSDACRVLREACRKRRIPSGASMPIVRTDNGPQFISNVFEALCQAEGITHERIPARTPNLNAHIEAFHSILEDECYSRNEFQSYSQAYAEITRYMTYYNERRRHGSLSMMSPMNYLQAFISNSIKARPFAA